MGLVTYYSRLIPDQANSLFPLHQLLKKNVRFKWGKEQDKAFTEIKKDIASDGVLAHFNGDLALILATDASNYGIGAVLSHKLPDGKERPFAFVSRTLNE